jgi:hypothetical protein
MLQTLVVLQVHHTPRDMPVGIVVEHLALAEIRREHVLDTLELDLVDVVAMPMH